MQILINNPVQQTILFGIVFVIVFIYFFRKKQDYTALAYTQELKGLAILAVVFGHIGYFLSIDQRFLFPFSILMGVGVNLFLFLSGYGITFSHIQKEEEIVEFYKKRLLRLFVPFWIVLVVLLASIFLFLGNTYSITFLIQTFLGIITHADISTDLNSPLWYFTLILFYYVLFPVLFNKKRPWVTAILIYIASWLIVKGDPAVLSGVIGLYKVHLVAFPLGVLIAWLVSSKRHIFEPLTQWYKKYQSLLYPILVPALLVLIGYFSIHSGIGESPRIEQTLSLVVMSALLVLFLIKKRESKIFRLFGKYSYEIYLFHWPLLYHYDFLYMYMPAWIATTLYLGLFVGLGILLQKLSRKLSSKS